MNIHVDPNGTVPIYRQISQQIKNAVAIGRLTSGTKLPSIRELSKKIEVNPNTVVRAYQELERDGVVESLRGVGTFVCNVKIKINDGQRRQRIEKIVQELLTEAYHLNFDQDELMAIIIKELEKWY
ncbi:MAG: GntR family transcriptional regulator [Firmicutes bacterium]|jgi:GntR family transcriptional regulator|nr:GntR family transcriptional regulator [Bacillota bacterium]